MPVDWVKRTSPWALQRLRFVCCLDDYIGTWSLLSLPLSWPDWDQLMGKRTGATGGRFPEGKMGRPVFLMFLFEELARYLAINGYFSFSVCEIWGFFSSDDFLLYLHICDCSMLFIFSRLVFSKLRNAVICAAFSWTLQEHKASMSKLSSLMEPAFYERYQKFFGWCFQAAVARFVFLATGEGNTPTTESFMTNKKRRAVHEDTPSPKTKNTCWYISYVFV